MWKERKGERGTERKRGMEPSLPVRSEREADGRQSDAPVPSKAEKDRREVASLKPPGAAGQVAAEVAAEDEEARRSAGEGAPLQRRPRSELAQPRLGPSKSREAQGAPHSRATGEAAAAWLSAPGAFYILQYDPTARRRRLRRRQATAVARAAGGIRSGCSSAAMPISASLWKEASSGGGSGSRPAGASLRSVPRLEAPPPRGSSCLATPPRSCCCCCCCREAGAGREAQPCCNRLVVDDGPFNFFPPSKR